LAVNRISKDGKIIGLLKRLNEGENIANVKKEAQEFLASIKPEELSFAEQKLLEAGLSPEDLRNLCSVHMEMLRDELGSTKLNLEPGHVIHTMMSEHDVILRLLDELGKVNQTIQKMESCISESEEFEKLIHIAEHLVEAEPHHKREEEVLFPELEKRGVFGPPRIMRVEHEDLRRCKRELKELAETVDRMDFHPFKTELSTVTEFIVPLLRDHIFKENNILYPTALQVVQGDDVWVEMKLKCDKIGYCCFTPQA